MTEQIFLRENNTVIITDVAPSGTIIVNWYSIEPFEKYPENFRLNNFKWLGAGFLEWINENKIPYISHGLLQNRKDKPAAYMIRNQKITYSAWYRYGEMHNDFGPACIRWDDHETAHYFRRHGVAIDDQVKEWQRKNNIPEWPNWTKDHKLLYKLKFM